MQIGQRIQIEAFHADGTRYRWWWATVEAVDEEGVVTVTPPGHRVQGVDRSWRNPDAIRAFFWTGKPYSLLEVYTPDGALAEIFVNINSPAEIDKAGIRYVDYELDVSRRPPTPAVLVDEDEFREAAERFGYSAEFRQACYEAAQEAVRLAEGWVARGAPRPGGGER